MGCGSSTIDTNSRSNKINSKMNKFKALVTVAELKALYDGTSRLPGQYKLLESAMTADGKADYDKGHIPDAAFFDLTVGVESSKLYPKNIPDKEKFAAYVGSLGISNQHHVIVYDRSPFGFLTAPRVWWLLRLHGHENVSVLNGGFTKWNAIQGQASLSTAVPEIQAQKFTANYNASFIRKYDYMVENLEKKASQVIDARPNEDFKGTAPTKVPEGKLGHMPNALNIPHMEMVNKTTGLFKSEDEILQVFNNTGVDLKKPIVLHCLTSITACTVLLGAFICGFDSIPLYTGSWFEWSQLAPEDKCVKD